MFLENAKHRMLKGEKPFTCNECSKSYSGQWNLKTHIITHSGENKFIAKNVPCHFQLVGRSNKLNQKPRKDLKPVPADSPDRRDYVSSGLSIVVITYWHHSYAILMTMQVKWNAVVWNNIVSPVWVLIAQGLSLYSCIVTTVAILRHYED